ncbi:MAG: Omp28-related outer membrane protein [Chlorobi bacterium]|nr:Omp28-related outer membrane protein [Chlorobiota bacterium]
MKKFSNAVIFILFALYANVLFGQTYVNEFFDTTMPPPDWSIDGHSDNWGISSTNKAGGASAPEAKLDDQPIFDGVTRLVTGHFDFSDISSIAIEFNEYINHWSGSFTVGVATRSNGGDWVVQWQKNVTSDVPAEKIWINVDQDVSVSDFQICWFFDGNTDNLVGWYIDDIYVYQTFEHDARTNSVVNPGSMGTGNAFAPEATVQNVGYGAEYFDVVCNIYENGNLKYTDTQYMAGLDAGQIFDVTFADFTPTTPDAEYKIEVTTMLDGDLNPDNDTKSETFSTAVRDRLVLWEQFTNTGCGPCASANPTIEQMLTNNTEDVVISIWAHVWWPSSGDPYYVANTTDNAARTNYYGVNGVPDSFVDGVLGPSPGNMSSMQAAVDERHNTPSVIDLHLEYDNNYKIRVEYTVVNTIPSGNYKLRIAVVENDLYYNASNGETHFNHVLRKYYPDAGGVSIDLSAKGDHDVLYFNLTMDPSWDLDNIEIFAFIQDDVMREVAQAAKATYSPIVPVELTSFSAIADGNNVSLLWETATESNNSGFEVERAAAGFSGNFDSPENLNWEKIGFIEGVGTTTENNLYKFTDDISSLTGKKIAYRLKQINFDGTYSYSDVAEVENALPSKFELSQNYPNPFNPTTTISYRLPFDSKVELKVFDLLGNEVATVVNQKQNAGTHKVNFSSSKLTSGVYFYRMVAGGFADTKKMTVLK